MGPIVSGVSRDRTRARSRGTRSPSARKMDRLFRMDRNGVVASVDDLERIAQKRFGIEALRPGQRTILEHVLRREDVLAILPTGGGKSLTYQLPALVLPGATIVVSPLISLMQDQVDKLRALGVSVGMLNSTMSEKEQRRSLHAIEHERPKIGRAHV